MLIATPIQFGTLVVPFHTQRMTNPFYVTRAFFFTARAAPFRCSNLMACSISLFAYFNAEEQSLRGAYVLYRSVFTSYKKAALSLCADNNRKYRFNIILK